MTARTRYNPSKPHTTGQYQNSDKDESDSEISPPLDGDAPAGKGLDNGTVPDQLPGEPNGTEDSDDPVANDGNLSDEKSRIDGYLPRFDKRLRRPSKLSDTQVQNLDRLLRAFICLCDRAQCHDTRTNTDPAKVVSFENDGLVLRIDVIPEFVEMIMSYDQEFVVSVKGGIWAEGLTDADWPWAMSAPVTEGDDVSVVAWDQRTGKIETYPGTVARIFHEKKGDKIQLQIEVSGRDQANGIAASLSLCMDGFGNIIGFVRPGADVTHFSRRVHYVPVVHISRIAHSIKSASALLITESFQIFEE
jgi:hypothetical protein